MATKSIRIKDHLYEEIQRLADDENRPLIRQLEMLLEQALRMDGRKPAQRSAEVKAAGTAHGGGIAEPVTPRPVASSKKCAMVVPTGTKCKACGKVH